MPERQESSPRSGRPQLGWLRWLLLVLVMALLAQLFWDQGRRVGEIPYSTFREKVAAGEVERVRIRERTIEGHMRTPLPNGRTDFVTVQVAPDIADELLAEGIEVTGTAENPWLRLLPWLIPFVLLMAFWLVILARTGQAASGFMSVGRSKAKVYVEQQTRVTFADVAGVDEAKEELNEIVQFLKDPQAYGELGAHLPKGVLLVGPPGTGKTLLARAIAGEAGVPFFSINGSEFVELFVGVGAARVRDLFDQARAQAPCIVFIDEIDALGRARGLAVAGGADEKEQTLNQLLAELDGFAPGSGVMLLAATNRPEILDAALLRAGRFDRQIALDRPDRAGRVAILQVHTRSVKLAPGLDLDQVAGTTPGFTGADLANLVNEAALVATRRRAAHVELPDFAEALERVVAGLARKNRLLSPDQRERVAVHETGHALVARALPDADSVQKVSIIPRGVAGLGFTIQQQAEDRYIVTRTELETRLAVLLGGRAAESIIFGDTSTGAADDLVRATALATEMVTQYGMDEGIGPVVFERPGLQFLPGRLPDSSELRRFSETTAREVELAIRGLVADALARARAILEYNRPVLEATAALLLERETLSSHELPAVEAPPRHQEQHAQSPLPPTAAAGAAVAA